MLAIRSGRLAASRSSPDAARQFRAESACAVGGGATGVGRRGGSAGAVLGVAATWRGGRLADTALVPARAQGRERTATTSAAGGGVWISMPIRRRQSRTRWSEVRSASNPCSSRTSVTSAPFSRRPTTLKFSPGPPRRLTRREISPFGVGVNIIGDHPNGNVRRHARCLYQLRRFVGLAVWLRVISSRTVTVSPFCRWPITSPAKEAGRER